MTTYEIYDENYSKDREYPHIRKAARAVIIDGDNIFVEETQTPRIIMLPGGGVEDKEDYRDCVKRECEEECGLFVKPCDELFAIKEYYKDKIFYSIYISCEIVGESKSSLTSNEKALGLKSGWRSICNVKRDIEEMLVSYPEGSELKGMHKREYIAINHIIEHCSNIEK